ncbi:ribosomal lysine N-methyltransferase 2 [[Candida] anglica]
MDKRIENLLQWINNTVDETYEPSTHSYISPKTIVKDDAEWGRGICATEPVRTKELIIRIPPSFLLNYTTVLKHICRHNDANNLEDPHYLKVYIPPTEVKDEFTKIYSFMNVEDLTNLSSFQLLSLYITFESQRQESSFWKPFLDMLPPISDFVSVPLTWHVLKVPQWEKLFDSLPESTRKHAEKTIQRFESDYETVCSLLKSKIEPNTTTTTINDDTSLLLPIDLFLWAWMCINSRCLYMDMPQKKNNSDNFTMSPYVDFLNHSCDDQCSLKIDSTGFQVFTGVSYKPGDQIFLSYGPHSNEFLLCEYGFMLNENKWNDLDVSSYILKALTAQQVSYLKENDYFGDYTINVDSGPSFRTEIALATMQEDQPSTSRKLQALVNGMTDGDAYELNSKILLDEIFKQVIKECEFKKNMNPIDANDDSNTILRKKVIKKLYDDRNFIVERHSL